MQLGTGLTGNCTEPTVQNCGHTSDFILGEGNCSTSLGMASQVGELLASLHSVTCVLFTKDDRRILILLTKHDAQEGQLLVMCKAYKAFGRF
jgi:hypothetical protein